MINAMKKNIVLLIFSALLLGGCSVQKLYEPLSYTLSLKLEQLPPSNQYINLDYGIRLNVTDKRANQTVLGQFDARPGARGLNLSTYPEIMPFVSESMRQYMQTLGFRLDMDINTDYMLQVDVTQFQVSLLSGMGWVGTVCLDVQVFDADNKQVYPRTAVTGRGTSKGMNLLNQDKALDQVLNDAYANALANIDWNRVAYFLKRADLPSEEKNKQVTGSGDTALEHTIIRWYVDSAPKGADVYWRVVSSTPDVKNTNQLYLGSTPYESTESFDVKGLTFNNSGDVQIEISCEKPGYITQKRRFNLRQAIEQKEISTKFNLVEE